MRDYSTLDLETDPFKKGRIPRAFAACFFDGKISTLWWHIDCCKMLIELIIKEGLKRDGELLVYAHNGGKFDFHYVLEFILMFFQYDELEILCIGSRIVSIKTPAFELRDSFSIIPKPLKSFGNKIDIKIEKLEADVRETHKEEICKYLKQDCVGLYNALGEFFERYGCEITLASTTFQVLKKQFGVKPIKTNLDYDDKFRPYYFAGRVQFFEGSLGCNGKQDGVKRYNICDINSAFPKAMMSEHWFGGGYDVMDSAPEVNKEQSFYNIVCDSKGCLPKRSKHGGVEFPVCEQTEFFATGWELFAGLELGLISNLKIKSVYVPRECQNFQGYVNYFYEMKKNAENPADRDFAKLFLNSCYGKFALNPREFREVCITKYGDKPDLKIHKVKGKTIAKVEWEWSYDDLQRGITFWQTPSTYLDEYGKPHPQGKPMTFYNVCTAASITGCVRAFLQRSISSCSGVLYCDTDSIIAADTSSLKLSDELGDWKLEKECDAVYIGGKKLYCSHDYRGKPELDEKGKPKWKEWKTASKGVRLTVEDLIAVCNGEEREYAFDAPNYSVFSKPSFTKRRVNRDDKRKKRAA